MPERVIHIARPDTGEEEWRALREPLESGWLTQGPKVAAFEKAFASRHSAKHALATTSCTTALHLILAVSLVIFASAVGVELDERHLLELIRNFGKRKHTGLHVPAVGAGVAGVIDEDELAIGCGFLPPFFE